MSDIAERGVMFLLRASIDPSARTVLASFGKELESIQSRASQATVDNSAKAVAVATEESRAVVQIHTDKIKAIENLQAKPKAIENAQEVVKQDDSNRLAEAAEESRALVQIQTEQVKKIEQVESDSNQRRKYSHEELLEMEEAENKRRADEFAKMHADELAERNQRNNSDLQKREAEEIRAAFRRADAVAKVEREAAQENTNQPKNRTLEPLVLTPNPDLERARIALVEKEVDDMLERNREKKRAAEEAEQKAHEKQLNAYRALADRARTASREVMNNFLEMGESAMRFARGLTMIGLVGEKDIDKVKDALLGMQGAFDVVSGLGRILTKTDQIMQGLTKATLAQAAAQALLNRTNAAGAATGAAGAVAGGGGAAVGAAVGGVGMAGRVAQVAIGVLTGPFGVLAAGAVAVSGALGLLYQSVKKAPKREAGDNSAMGVKDLNFSQWLLMSATSGSSTAAGNTTGSAAKKNLIGSEKATNAMEKKTKLADEMNERDRGLFAEQDSKRTHALREQHSIQEAMLHNRYEQATSAEKTKIIEQQIAKHAKEAISGTAGARQEVIKWMEKRLSHEREISREQKQAATESLRSSQDQLRSIEQQIASRRDANMSAAESFGMKSEDEQQEIISIKKRVDQGDKSVTPEEIGKLKGLSNRTDRQISTFAQGRAKAAGFDQAFGKENAQDIKQLEAIQKKLQVEVKQKTDVVVKIDRDIEAEAQLIAKQITVQQTEQNKELAKRIQEVAAEQAKINSRFKGRTGTIIQ